MKKFILLIIAILLISSVSFAKSELNYISIINLIGSPEKYDGKPVRFTGFLFLEFEGNAIYLHKSDKDNHIYKNGLWFELSKKEYLKYHNKYVTIEGVFNAKDKGHLGLWSGSIQKVTRVFE
ncbi:MAG: hypothetical protein GY777_22265 [Candidatus Brocadiaceae bacterium]|nr:hypothetical protein [Candidatus Brocadiaceae bacterium]